MLKDSGSEGGRCILGARPGWAKRRGRRAWMQRGAIFGVVFTGPYVLLVRKGFLTIKRLAEISCMRPEAKRKFWRSHRVGEIQLFYELYSCQR
jgi:hypothetical protein